MAFELNHSMSDTYPPSIFQRNILVNAYQVARTHHTKTLPDIHLYLDYSNSIMGRDELHRDVVTNVLTVARRMNVDVYVTSFSHQLGETLHCTFDQTLEASEDIQRIWQQITQHPKTDGGTNYAAVWEHINTSELTARQMSIIVTDFQWAPARADRTIHHPDNLYYAKMEAPAHEKLSFGSVTQFIEHITTIDPTVMTKILNHTIEAKPLF